MVEIVKLIKDLRQLWLRCYVYFFECLTEFLRTEFSIILNINGSEGFSEGLHFLALATIVNYECQSLELEPLRRFEVSQSLDNGFVNNCLVAVGYWEPPMAESVVYWYPLFGIFIEHLLNEVLYFFADVSPVLRVKLYWLREDVLKDFLVVVSFEWSISTEHHEKDDS